MVKQLGLETLQDRIKIDKATMVFRIKNQLIDIKENQHFKPAKRILRGQAKKFQVPQSRMQIYLHSFFPLATRIWNSLPSDAVNQEIVPAFKAALKNWVPKH